MNFQTMNKQRRFILLSSLTGIIAMFLPWVDILFENFNGMHGTGNIVFACFIIIAILSITGNRAKTLDKNPLMLTLILGAMAVFIMIVFYFKARLNVTYGFYIAFLASISILLAAYFFRASDQDAGDTDNPQEKQ